MLRQGLIRSSALLLWSGLLGIAGCYDSYGGECAVGSSVACTAARGCEGVRRCAADGSGFGECVCGAPPIPIDGGPRPPMRRDLGPGAPPDLGPTPVDPGPGDSFTFTLQLVGVHRESFDGRSRGIDLDGRISDETDDLGCNQEDWEDPLDGERGVDNTLALLAPTLEAALGMSLDEGVEAFGAAVDIRLIGVDGSRTDPGVALGVGGEPPRVVPMRGGRFQGTSDRGLEVWLTVAAVRLRGVGVDARLTASGTLTDVVVVGHFDIDDVVETVTATAPDIDPGLVRTTLEAVADLDPGGDGLCRSISAVYDAEVVSR